MHSELKGREILEKIKAREIVKKKKAELNPQYIEEYSAKVCEKLLEQDFYKEAKTIYLYIAYNNEIKTDRIFEQAWKDGKKVAIPKVKNSEDMDFYYIDSFNQVEKGYRGILEPKVAKGQAPADDKNVLLIMPGLAFDYNHNRTGYGGGFYDRFLKKNPDKKYYKACFAYDFQLFNNLIVENHDEKVDAIIYENSGKNVIINTY